ncbi:hypothetical protein CIB48_g9832 [Xylaria polymorpha]|nr:hypothetical protein CIB48_g9832 [Xylaria polymorpha]
MGQGSEHVQSGLIATQQRIELVGSVVGSIFKYLIGIFNLTFRLAKKADAKMSTFAQTERAYQRQPHIGIASRSKSMGVAWPGKRGARFYRDIGLDKKFPFTGLVSIRGRILTGTVVSIAMNRTIIIRREYLHHVAKYSRYEKRHKNVPAHLSPAFHVSVGDKVIVGQCRPLSKTVRFNVVRMLPRTKTAVKQFTLF